jgi:mannobiose 2-epimerase
MGRIQDILLKELKQELEGDILPFWLSLQDPSGGFWGEVGTDGSVHRDAERGAVLYSRILWTFSAAWGALGTEAYLKAATHAFDYLVTHILDARYGGAFWSVDAHGQPANDKKQLYAQGFAIYGLSEYYRASGSHRALDEAVKLFELVEAWFHDDANGGYREALGRDFGPLDDMSLSAHDINAAKTMNSHLHLLEAYANLYSVWPDDRLRRRVVELLDLLCHKIMTPDGHLGLYFTDSWETVPAACSYGHDIETSWLASECVRILGDDVLRENVERFAMKMAAAGNLGLLPDGSMAYERFPDGRTDLSRQWWVQAEAVAGNLWAWRFYGDQEALSRAAATWGYIKDNLLDRERGEWFWGVNADGTTDLDSPKAGLWKCPYHNSRMCLQAMKLI